MAAYIISIDQSTQGTKALLFDENGQIVHRTDCAHRQIINEKGWVSHDPEEIYQNVLKVTQELLDGIDKSCVAGVGISNQRETTLAWNRISGNHTGRQLYGNVREHHKFVSESLSSFWQKRSAKRQE